MYYVYEWYNVDTGEILYVGKGTGNRYKVKHGRNKLQVDAFHKYNCQSRIIKEFEDEKDAFAYEYERIEELRSQGLCSCNIYDGGNGGSREYWTDDMRKAFSKHNPMKNNAQRDRMSMNNPMKNKDLREKMSKFNPMKNPEIVKRVVEKKSRHVIIGDAEYNSLKEAGGKYHITSTAIFYWCKNGINSFGEPCRYANNS